MATVYLPVTARLNLTSEQRAKGISRIQHPTTGQWACVGDTDLTITVHPQRDLHALIALFPQLTQEERDAMTFYLATNEVVMFQYLMPSDAEILTQEQAEAAGWFGDGLDP